MILKSEAKAIYYRAHILKNEAKATATVEKLVEGATIATCPENMQKWHT